MSDASSILSLKKALSGAVSAGKAEETKNILEQLKSDVKATEELLRETKIGLTVGKLRSNENKEVAALAKELVKKTQSELRKGRNRWSDDWKEEVGARTAPTQVKAEKATEAQSPSTSTKPSPSPAPSSSTTQQPQRKPSPTTNGSSSSITVKPEPGRATSGTPNAGSPPASTSTMAATSAKPNGQTRSSKTDKVDCSATDDKTRNKCIELVYDSLATDSEADSEIILKRSKDIESSTYKNISDVGQYRAKMRSLYLNLKDKSNPALRASVISGTIDSTLLWSMSPQDMASAEKKAELAEFSKAALFSAQGAAPKKAETDMFECGKCRKKRATYYQMQTRSADEPMTTFVTCLACGHNWRFS